MHHNLCDACETVVHCSSHGCVPLQQLAHAEAHHADKGYELGNPDDYETFVAQRNKPKPTYEEVLHELWYLRRRISQLEMELQYDEIKQPTAAG